MESHNKSNHKTTKRNICPIDIASLYKQISKHEKALAEEIDNYCKRAFVLNIIKPVDIETGHTPFSPIMSRNITTTSPLLSRSTPTSPIMSRSTPTSPIMSRSNLSSPVMSRNNTTTSPLSSPQLRETSKFSETKHKLDEFIQLLEGLARIQIIAAQYGHDYKLNITNEINKIYNWLLTNPFSKDEQELLYKLQDDKSQGEKYQLLYQLCQVPPLPETILYTAFTLNGLKALENRREAVKVIPITEVKSALLSSIECKNPATFPLQRKLNKLEKLLTTPEETYKHSKTNIAYSKNILSLASDSNNQLLNDSIKKSKVKNFIQYQKILNAAIAVLTDPCFNPKDKETVASLHEIIYYYNRLMNHLITKSSHIKSILDQEHNHLALVNTIMSQIDFADLSEKMINGMPHSKEEELIKIKLEDKPFQVICLSGGNAPVYKITDLSTGAAVVIRRRPMNEMALDSTNTPDHIRLRFPTIIGENVSCVSKLYALVPGAGITITGLPTEYCNYEISQFAAGGSLKNKFVKLHADVHDEQSTLRLQLQFLTHAKQLIFLHSLLKENFVVCSDIKTSNIMLNESQHLQIISDIKTFIDLINIADPFHYKSEEPLALTGGFYSPMSVKDGVYDLDRLANETFVISMFEMLSGEDMENIKHRRDFNTTDQILMLNELLKNKNSPLFHGEIGSILYDFLKQMISIFMSGQDLTTLSPILNHPKVKAGLKLLRALEEEDKKASADHHENIPQEDSQGEGKELLVRKDPLA